MKSSFYDRLVVDHQNNKTLAAFVHAQFRSLVLSPHYTCVGAKAAFNQNAYLFGMHEEIGSLTSAESLYSDLNKFIYEYQKSAKFPSTLVASFRDPVISSEIAFEKLLWKHLRLLHDLDKLNQWDSAFSTDPRSSHFSFSVLSKGFFIVGLHPTSSRWSRRFAWPTLIFNAQEQFESLKAKGTYEKMETINRHRDEVLQGSINPNITDFAEESEARQYSGRHVEKDWQCPFHT